jgi:hypothetical protein
MYNQRRIVCIWTPLGCAGATMGKFFPLIFKLSDTIIKYRSLKFIQLRLDEKLDLETWRGTIPGNCMHVVEVGTLQYEVVTQNTRIQGMVE